MITKKRTSRKTVKRRKAVTTKKQSKANIAASYNKFKFHEGKFYTGMGVGRSLVWHYDKGDWKDTKITPELWKVSYAVTKRRAGKAPKGSGAAVGTSYHWYIMAHQTVTKLNADDYSTSMIGLKYKLAHKRAGKNKWSAHTPTQRKHIIDFLKEMIKQLETQVVELEFEYNGEVYKGEAVPIPETCSEGICHQLDITLNDEHMGIIRALKSGWKMDGVDDQKLVNAIAEQVMIYYQ